MADEKDGNSQASDAATELQLSLSSKRVSKASTTFAALTGLEAGIAERLKARLSYGIEHDTDPPENTKPTDTLSRISLIYDF